MSPHPTPVDGEGAAARRWPVLAAVGTGYLVLSLLLWWHVDAHLTTVTTCGCGDASLTLWVIRWPAYALAHGLNPFYSSKLLVPAGINMAPNSLALGVGVAPVTWMFGPVASMNVIDIVSPALSALSMCWLLRRWVDWTPAAVVGGLAFGFSPFVVGSLALAHPNFGLLAVIPPIIACVEDLVVRHRHQPVRVGVVLGVLVTLQFFISVEVLLLLVLFTVFAAILAIGIAPSPRTAAVREAAGQAISGVVAAAVTAVVLLAYPLWSFFAGPAHLVGRAWPNSPAGTVGSTPGGFFTGTLPAALVGIMRLFGGYQGPALPLLSFVGVGMAVVLVVGLVVWRHDRRLWFFAVLAVVGAVLSLGVGDGYWGPWRLFVHLPVLSNVVPVNVTVITDLCLAVVLALTIDHARTSVARRWGDRRSTTAAGLVALVALVPIVVVLWPNLPLTARTVVVPHWFTQSASSLPAGSVVLPYPAALGGIQASMTWQAEGNLSYSMVGGGGPGVAPSRAGAERPGFDLLAQASLPLGPAPQPTADNLAAIRHAMAGWGTTTVVVPDQPELPTYERGRSVAYAVGLFTAATGRAPVFRDDAWVWDDLHDLPAAVPMDPVAFAACTGDGLTGAPAGPVASCVLAHRAAP
jgi:hypothetical protein